MTIAEVNGLDRETFVASLGWIFEGSPWVAEEAGAARPFADLRGLHAAMAATLARAEPAKRLSLLCAHPDLGTRARISPASTGEQSGAGLDALTQAEFDYLQELNSAYRARFGFPFLLAVNGCTKYDVFRALEQRLPSSPEQELLEAMRQVSRIAEFRLQDTIK